MKNLFLYTLILALFLTACQPAITPTTEIILPPEKTPTPSVLVLGPETISNQEYPSSITFEQARQLLAQPEPPIPYEIATSSEVLEILQQHSARARAAGVNINDPDKPGFLSATPHMLSNGINWTITMDRLDGTLGAWLQLKDGSSKTGILYAQQPTWDPLLSKGYEVAGYGLPELTNPSNHFDFIDVSGFVILVEVNPDGIPDNWYNYNEKSRILFADGKPMTEPTARSWSLEIPATPEECTNVIRNDSFEHMEEDVAFLNRYIMQHRPIGERFPVMRVNGVSGGYMPRGFLPFTFIDFGFSPEDAESFQYVKLLSCSKYGDGFVFGAFLPVGQKENQTILPVQVFYDETLNRKVNQDAGLVYEEYENIVITNSNSNKARRLQWRLSGEFSLGAENHQDSLTGQLLKYLDDTYDYSARLWDITHKFGSDPIRDQETIAIFQHIMLPGIVGPVIR